MNPLEERGELLANAAGRRRHRVSGRPGDGRGDHRRGSAAAAAARGRRRRPRRPPRPLRPAHGAGGRRSSVVVEDEATLRRGGTGGRLDATRERRPRHGGVCLARRLLRTNRASYWLMGRASLELDSFCVD